LKNAAIHKKSLIFREETMKETKLETIIRMTKVLNQFKEQHPGIIDIGVMGVDTFFETLGKDLPSWEKKNAEPNKGGYAGYIRIKCSETLKKKLDYPSIWEYLLSDNAEDAIIGAVQVMHAVCTTRGNKAEAEFLGRISRALRSLDFNPTV
jgi:hypothetical protein